MTKNFSKTILDNLTTAIVGLDRDLNIVYTNLAFEMIFDLSAKRALGMPVQQLPLVEDRLVQLVRDVQDSGEPHTEWALELSLISKKRAIVDCSVIKLELEGKIELIVELHQVDQHLKLANDEQRQEKVNSAKMLVRNLAHEIKNPLGGLRGAAQLLQREQTDPNLNEYTEIIVEEADRLSNLVNQLLGPNKLPEKRWINVHQVLERLVTLVSAEGLQKIDLVKDYDPSLPEVFVDHDQLFQACLNIVNNAIQAMGEQGTLTFRTRVCRNQVVATNTHALMVRMDICDTGSGIDAEMIDKIFLPMVTSRAQGSGLGLSISQALVDQQGGKIECKSRPGDTVFSILLPITPPQEGENHAFQ